MSRNATNFSGWFNILQLYWNYLLVLRGSVCVCVKSLGALQNLLSVNKDNFTTFLPIWMPFVSFSCLIALAKHSNICLIEVVKAGTLVLFLTLEESCQPFTIEYDVSCGGEFCIRPLLCWSSLLLLLICWEFLSGKSGHEHWGACTFSN